MLGFNISQKDSYERKDAPPKERADRTVSLGETSVPDRTELVSPNETPSIVLYIIL
jgi:hypothetical protein